MKLTFVLLTVSFLQISAKSVSQNVTISLKDAPLFKVFKEIEKQTGFGFLFSKNILKDASRVNINVKNAPVSDVLNRCFEGQPFEYTIENSTIVVSRQIKKITLLPKSLPPPPVKITGKVLDENGQPVAGASVQLKNSSVGTSTNANGEYELEVPDNSSKTLVFSYVGMQSQEVAINGKASLNIFFKKFVSQQDEIVVVGYGTQKKANLLGSVSQIKSNAIKERAITTLGEAFAGQIAGVRAQQVSAKPGAEFSIKIRGVSTVSASTSPLYIIDGIPTADLTDFNPNDIASIEVLKDASSASIYGARGSNGVVLITTKTGKGNTSFTFETYTGIQKVDKLLPMMNRDQFIAFHKYQFDLQYLRSGGSLSDPLSTRPSSFRYPDSWLNPSSLPDVNWQKQIYHTAPIQSYQVSASGGGEKGNFLLSGAYMKQDGIVKYSKYERANFRLNSTLNVSNRLKVGMNLAPSFSTSNNPDDESKESALHHALNTPPIVGLNSNTEQWGYTPVAVNWPNPLERLKEVKQQTKTARILSNIWGELNIIKSVTFRSQFGYNYLQAKASYFKPSNVANGNKSQGRADYANTSDWTFQNTFSYNPKISGDFDLNVLLGQSIEEGTFSGLATSAIGYPNDFVTTLNVASTPTSASTSESRTAMTSYFGRVNFIAKNKYLLNITVREDGSSKFGKDKKWGLFPSVSAGWKINNESFLRNNKWISLLKLRASIGKSGNDKIGNYESISLLGIANYNLNGGLVNGLAPRTFANPDLGWETKISKVLGIDLAAFNNRIQTSFEYYIDDTKDMLLNVNVPYISGYSSFRQNIGQVQNRGWEFELTSQNLKGVFEWSSSFNISRNRNEVKKLGPGNSPIITTPFGPPTYITKVGEAISSLYMYHSIGVLTDKDFDANGNPVVPIYSGQEKGNVKIADLNNDGLINEKDKTIVGSNQPKFIWGLNNRIQFKGFDLNILLQGSQGSKVFYAAARHISTGDAWGANQYAYWTRQWRPTNELALPNNGVDMSWDGKTPFGMGEKFPNFYDGLFLSDASFVRIKNIALGYNLPASLCKRLYIGNARIYIMGDNVYTFTKFVGANPENSTFPDNDFPGMDYGSYPLSRKYSIGINLTFK